MGVKERLIEFLSYEGIGQKRFAESIGMSSGYVNAIRKSIQPDTIHKIAMQYPDLNTGWLLTGEGEMLRDGVSAEKTVDDEKENKAYTIPLLPVSAQGGSLSNFAESVRESDCEKIISPIKGADFAMPVAGDSMAPEYPAGSQIFIKKINERAFIDWGRVYVLDTCNGTVIKRVYPTDDPNIVECRSINPEYPPFKVSVEDVYGMYRVLMCMSMK